MDDIKHPAACMGVGYERRLVGRRHQRQGAGCHVRNLHRDKSIWSVEEETSGPDKPVWE